MVAAGVSVTYDDDPASLDAILLYLSAGEATHLQAGYFRSH